MKRFLIWPFVFIASFSRKFRFFVIKHLIKIREILEEESRESVDMAGIYIRFTQGKASAEDLKIANAQFADIIKTAGLGALFFLPFAPLTIPFVVRLGKAFNIDVLPNSVKERYKF